MHRQHIADIFLAETEQIPAPVERIGQSDDGLLPTPDKVRR